MTNSNCETCKEDRVVKCPCVDCVCIAICRLKTYSKLIGGCGLVSYYVRRNLSSTPGPFLYRIDIRDIIKPIEWEVDSDGIFIDTEFPPLSV